MDCLFCKIIAGEIPSNKLYEDELCCAFYDIDPQADTHFLVVPKTHVASMADVTEAEAAAVAHIFTVIPKLCRNLGLSGYRVISNCGRSAGQTVMHLHFHVLSGPNLGARLV